MEKKYALQGTPAEDGYHGCGHGVLVVNKETDIPISMCYGVEEMSSTQNVKMLRDGTAGNVFKEDDATIAYIVNFSCWEACLF